MSARASAARPVILADDADHAAVEIRTPEGVPLMFRVANVGERTAAFLLDVLLIVAAGFLMILAAVLAWSPFGSGGNWLAVLLMLGLFFLRYVYFAWFEAGGRGATPGKRKVGLRVVDASGGPLTAEAVLVRNLTREIEMFIPLFLLVQADVLWPTAPGWARLLGVGWALLFSLVPVFNRRHLRLGDFVAGTMVVRVPRAVLLADIGASRPAAAQTAPSAPGPAEAAAAPAPEKPSFEFTDAQLDVYGIYELQVLEEVLRRRSGGDADVDALRVVADKIRKKIRWEGAPPRSDEPFLRAFYAALRARLEHRMLLGTRKEDKHSH